MKVSIVPQTTVGLHEILSRSAVADVPGADEVLSECMFRSVEIRYGMLDGEVACVWGLIPPTLLSTRAYLWLLTTDIVVEHKFLFVRYSQRYVEEALKRYDEIIGDVILPNRSALRWIKWLGGEFGPEVAGRMSFTIKAKHSG